MPSIVNVHVEQICANCKNYKWHFRESGGWAYCESVDDWFPNQKGWAKGDGSKAPGMRTCKDFEVKHAKPNI